MSISFEEWMEGQEYDQMELEDIVKYGCKGSTPRGLTGYAKTVELYETFHEDIWRIINKEITKMEEDNDGKLENWCIKIFKEIGNDNSMKNELVWFAADTIALKILKKSLGENSDA